MPVLRMRRCASADIGCRRVFVCLSVCLSHAGIVSTRLHGSRWFFFVHGLPSTTLCFQEIRVSPKIWVLPS